eukprot:gnl/TRDRNA2_/TRDRNA2_169272_c5_seq1.p1 gnl/TRDRNA2_/TRDRNA2_169272_c5~~gnl/TRDRNA2_/TRDRNA2_169272_c5_seq1.p1  ORF type:complete len:410 (+),score=42.25 gnl/TRDRNA2_/TRDRNA2_169272_c5_seq1:32-1231(+)
MATVAEREAKAYLDAPERVMFRPSRTCYPGSKFGPKTRYDLPRRHKAYGDSDEADTILYEGTSLQPLAWTAVPSNNATLEKNTTPRGQGVFMEAARSVFHPLAQRNLPDLPMLDENNDIHGILVIGGKGVGKTSLVLSMGAMVSGCFPTRYDHEVQKKMAQMPTYGQSYEFPEREVQLGDGANARVMRVVLTDTPACGTTREEQPLCASISPNSTQHFNAIPSWMRISMRGGSYPHYAVLVVIDSTAKPLWEDGARCRDMARLLAVLRKSQYTAIIAVTKLIQARETALRDTAHGRGSLDVGKDPRGSYESFSGRYLEKVCLALQAKAKENDWSISRAEATPFPMINSTIFDIPTWTSVGDYKHWQSKTGTKELPNLKYMTNQMSRLYDALCTRSHPAE